MAGVTAQNNKIC